MPLNKGKHIVDEIQGIRCTIVETGVSKERMEFLKELLEFNKLEVITDVEPGKGENPASTYRIGVTDLIFNPVIAVYARILRSKEGFRVTPAFWNQWSVPKDIPYWKLKESNLKPV